MNEGREVIQSAYVTIKRLHEDSKDTQPGVSETPTGHNGNNAKYQLPRSPHSCLVLIQIPKIQPGQKKKSLYWPIKICLVRNIYSYLGAQRLHAATQH